MDVTIRPARKEDCTEIRRLIQELADYEKMPDGPQIGVETLEKDGFGDNPLYQCIVAENNEKLVGYAMFYFTYSTWGGKSMYLEDLYVMQEFRRKGVGDSLFTAVAKRAFDANCHRVDFCVLSWNPAVDYYKKKGAIDITESEQWHHHRLTSDTLKKLAEGTKN